MGSRSPVPISSIYLNKLNINTAKWELIQSTYNSSQDFIEAALTDPQGAYLLLSTFAKPTPTPEPTPTSTPSITPTPTPIPTHTLIPTPTFTTTPTQTPVPSLTLTPTRTPAPIPRITGFIFDAESAKPVNGAAVQIDNGALQSFSNAKGQYFIYDVPAGAHKLQMWGFAYEFKEKNIIVPANGVLDMGNETLAKIGGTVVGRLVDSATNEPLPEAVAQIDGGNQWRTLTDEQGYFMMIFVTPGAHVLQAWGNAYTFQEFSIFVNANAHTDVGTKLLSIIPDAARGQVVDKKTGRPLMNAHVQYNGGGAMLETQTNRSGRFVLVNVPEGNHELQTWGWAYSFSQQPFYHSSGTATDLGKVFIEPIGGTVNGRLLDAINGLPIYNAVIQLDGGNYAPWKTTSLQNGDFIVYDVTGGTHQFQTWGYAYRFMQQKIETIANQNKKMGDIQLTPDPNTFNGRVLDAQTRLPIPNAEIICTGAGKNIAAKSFPDGRFVLLNVPKGVFDITINAGEKNLFYFRAAHPGLNLNVELGDVLMP
ncbi:MAG: hypothetical protein BWY12_01132 [candidate division BRC1 bacterium ADurb.Bin183]|mgnify:CR=1 FL=1|nr:MAG: hypothetical protein BWY12_01132 [candidate division BRC1 bacterium ADurb.Bin183]